MFWIVGINYFIGGRILEITDRESIMKQWDSWRKYIANGGKSSWPRDAFESVLDYYEEQIEAGQQKDYYKPKHNHKSWV